MSASLLVITDGGVVDEQEIAATVEPEERDRTLSSGVSLVDDVNPTLDSGVSPVAPGVSPVDDEDPPGAHPCDGGELISFEGFPRGTILAEQYAAGGVHMSAEVPSGRPSAAVAFDSGATGTFNPDLEIGIGNLAIIPEYVADEDGDGLVDTRSDTYIGGTQIFTFDQDREVLYVVIVDIDLRSVQEIKTFDAGGAEIATVLNRGGDGGSVETIAVGAQGVRRLEITYWDGAAIAEICLDARY